MGGFRSSLDWGAVGWGLLAVAGALALVGLGSGGLRWFDAALVGYLFGTLFAIFGTVYRYRVWLRRPPTALLNRRGWEAFRAGGVGSLARLVGLAASNLGAQAFIRRRSTLRWTAHLLVFWGCALAAASPFRWSSAGCTSSRSGRTPRDPAKTVETGTRTIVMNSLGFP